jgi:hypothetical protein
MDLRTTAFAITPTDTNAIVALQHGKDVSYAVRAEML